VIILLPLNEIYEHLKHLYICGTDETLVYMWNG